MQFDKGYHLALLHHRRRGARKSSSKTPMCFSSTTARSPSISELLPVHREGRAGRQACAADHRRGRRRGSPLDCSSSTGIRKIARCPWPRRRLPAFGDRRKAIDAATSRSSPAPQLVSAEIGHQAVDHRPVLAGARHRSSRDRHQGRPPRSSKVVAPPRRSPTASPSDPWRDRVHRQSDWDKREAPGAPRQARPVVSAVAEGRRATPRSSSRRSKHRIEDAVSATRAAIDEGIVAGGGSSLVHSAAALSGDPRAVR